MNCTIFLYNFLNLIKTVPRQQLLPARPSKSKSAANRQAARCEPLFFYINIVENVLTSVYKILNFKIDISSFNHVFVKLLMSDRRFTDRVMAFLISSKIDSLKLASHYSSSGLGSEVEELN